MARKSLEDLKRELEAGGYEDSSRKPLSQLKKELGISEQSSPSKPQLPSQTIPRATSQKSRLLSLAGPMIQTGITVLQEQAQAKNEAKKAILPTKSDAKTMALQVAKNPTPLGVAGSMVSVMASKALPLPNLSETDQELSRVNRELEAYKKKTGLTPGQTQLAIQYGATKSSEEFRRYLELMKEKEALEKKKSSQLPAGIYGPVQSQGITRPIDWSDRISGSKKEIERKTGLTDSQLKTAIQHGGAEKNGDLQRYVQLGVQETQVEQERKEAQKKREQEIKTRLEELDPFVRPSVSPTGNKKLGGLSPEQIEANEKEFRALQAQLSSNAFKVGALDEATFGLATALTDEENSKLKVTDPLRYAVTPQGIREANPEAYQKGAVVGNLASTMALYGTVGKAVEGLKVFQDISSPFVRSLAAGQAADLAISAPLTAARSISQGRSWQEVLADVGVDQALGFAGNLGAAGIEAIFRKVKAGKALTAAEEAQLSAQPLSQHNRTLQQVSEDFAKQVDAWEKGELPKSRVFDLGTTPRSLVDVGASEFPLRMDQSVMEKITLPKGSGDGSHALGVEIVKQLPEKLDDPIMILQSATQPQSVVVVTDMLDQHGNGIIVAVRLDAKDGFVDVNKIASAYGKRDTAKFLQKQIDQGRLLALNETKATEWFSRIGLQLPKRRTTDGLIDGIYTTAEPHSIGLQLPEESADSGSIYSIAESAENINSQTVKNAAGVPVNLSETNPQEIKVVKEFLAEDESILKPNIDPEMAQQLTGKGVSRNKDFARNLDAAAGGDKRLRAWLNNEVESPFLDAKDRYSKETVTRLNQYKKDMDSLGIKKGSKESAAVQWIGEGQRQMGDKIVPYTLEQLKQDFPTKWEDIVKADAVNRKIYDEYITRINHSLEEIYPDVLGKAQQELERLTHEHDRLLRNIESINLTKSELETQIQDKMFQYGQLSNKGTKKAQNLLEQVNNLQKRYDNMGLADLQAMTDQAQEVLGRIDTLKRNIDSGEVLQNKRLTPRKDYYHHFQEMESGFGGLKNTVSSPSDIDPRLVGVSQYTQPKTKWEGFMQRRKGGKYTEDAVGGMIQYIPAAEYKVNIDPIIARNREIVRELANATKDSRNANKFISWMTEWSNGLAGKTNPLDHLLRDHRTALRGLNWLNSRVKSSAVLGNVSSAVSQFFNLPNATVYIKNPADWAKGLKDYAASLVKNDDALDLLAQSPFMRERYMSSAIDQFDEGILKTPRKLATWMLNTGDEQASKLIWYSAYEQAQRQGVENAIAFADDITRRSVAGRGIGELPITQQSKLVQLIAPFQVEVNNTWQLLKERAGAKDALGLTALFVTSHLMNNMAQSITGRRVSIDPIQAVMDAVDELQNEEGSMAAKVGQGLGRVAGEFVSNMPFGAQIASFIPEEQRVRLFGDSDPTRFGTGNIGLNLLLEPGIDLVTGKTPDMAQLAFNLMLPFGGKQAERSFRGLQDVGVIPRLTKRLNLSQEAKERGIAPDYLEYIASKLDEETDTEKKREKLSNFGLSADQQRWLEQNLIGGDLGTSYQLESSLYPASYSASGGQRFPIDTSDPLNTAKSVLFGPFSTTEGQSYLEDRMKPLSEKQTALSAQAFIQGINPEYFDYIARQMKTKSTAEEKRQMLKDFGELTPKQKKWLDGVLISKNSADYESDDAYVLFQLAANQKKGYEQYGKDYFSAAEYAAAAQALKGKKKKADKVAAILMLGYEPAKAQLLYNCLTYREN